MGACATKPKVPADEADIPAPEPIDDMVKNTKEFKVVEDEKKVDITGEKKMVDTEKVVTEEEKPRSLDSLLVEKETAPVVEVPIVTKAEEPRKEAPAAEEVKKSEEKATEKGEKSA